MPNIFLVITPGLEEIAAQEVKDTFGKAGFYRGKMAQPLFPDMIMDWRALFRANRELRVPNRILVRIGQFRAVSFPELVKKAARLPWKDFLTAGTHVSLRTTCKKSKLYHSDAVSERIHTALQNCMEGRIERADSTGEDDSISGSQLIITRILHDEVTISLDSSGSPLHQRGYRLASGKAPLRENLAAGLILASGWTPGQTLIDPFCGSGTIPIEAALMQNKLLHGKQRKFIFENWPIYHNLTKTESSPAINPPTSPVESAPIFGSDRDAGVIQMAIENSERAHVSNSISWAQQAFSHIQARGEPGWIITNPPYGQRVSSNQELRNLYAQLGNVLRRDFRGWKVVFLCSDITLATQTLLSIKPILSFSNGGIDVKAYYAEIPA